MFVGDNSWQHCLHIFSKLGVIFTLRLSTVLIRMRLRQLFVIQFVFCLAQFSFGQIDVVVQSGHTSDVTSLLSDSKRSLLYSADGDGNIAVWDVETRLQRASLQFHTKHVASMAISKDGSHLLSGGGDKQLVY